MKKSRIILILVGLVVLVAIATNPSPEKHKEALTTKLKEYFQEDMNNCFGEPNSGWERIGHAFGMMLGNALIEPIIDEIVSRGNYLVFSTTKITWEGETNMVGIGLFGQVFITKELDEKLNDGSLDIAN